MPRPNNPIPPGAPQPLAQLALALRALREHAGLTLKQLATEASCSESALSEAASGKKLPTWEITSAYVRGCGDDPRRWQDLWGQASAFVVAQSTAALPGGGASSPAVPHGTRAGSVPVPKPGSTTRLSAGKAAGASRGPRGLGAQSWRRARRAVLPGKAPGA
jgi:DNA-binding XRE family transcriptional regulator